MRSFSSTAMVKWGVSDHPRRVSKTGAYRKAIGLVRSIEGGREKLGAIDNAGKTNMKSRQKRVKEVGNLE